MTMDSKGVSAVAPNRNDRIRAWLETEAEKLRAQFGVRIKVALAEIDAFTIDVSMYERWHRTYFSPLDSIDQYRFSVDSLRTWLTYNPEKVRDNAIPRSAEDR